MTRRLFDTSAWVKYYYPEQGSDQVEAAILSATEVWISQLALAEMVSALSIKVRTGALSLQDRDRILAAVDTDMHARTVRILDLTSRHAERARLLLRQFADQRGLRTLDALQVSVALLAAPDEFLSADRRLCSLAAELGLAVTPV